MLSSLRKQNGLALLMAMLIVVIATTVAVSIVHEEQFTIRKTAHIRLMDRAGLYAFGLEDWAQIYLREDREESDVDSLDEYWAAGIPGLPIEGGYLTGYLEDEQAKFNLNTLVLSEVALNRFKRLCDNLEVDDRFIPALMDWIDQDFDIRYPDGMEENYENYRVANREMADISELMLVENVTPEIYEKLKPYITALPAPTTLNVNTMSEVISRVSPRTLMWANLSRNAKTMPTRALKNLSSACSCRFSSKVYPWTRSISELTGRWYRMSRSLI